MKKLKGLIAAPFTGFTNEGEVDLSKVRLQKDFYKSNGMAGVFICGTTGEGSSLQKEEVMTLFNKWSEFREDDFAVIAFCGGTCIKDCINLALTAQECRLDAVAMTAPYYQKPENVESLCECCHAVAEAVPQMPFYYYHIPSLTGVNFQMYDFLKKADGLIPNLAGIKYTFENIMDYQLCLNFADGKYNVMWGRDEMMLSALAVGAQTFVGSTYGYMAPVYNRIIELFHGNRIREAAEMQLEANKVTVLLNRYGGGCGKALMKAAGLDLGPCRLPLRTLTNPQYEQLIHDLADTSFEKHKCTCL